MTNTRSIFEDVSEKNEPVAPRKGRGGARRAISVWLMAIFALVVLMIMVGGITRLTDSGLSITEWKPVTGAIPPMSAGVWADEFARYQATPEFQLQNTTMTLAEFKGIYWWEWTHRFLGRFIGLVWALGFFWFLARKQIPKGWTPRLLWLGVLGGLQGVVGWWMVSSGLSGHMVDVASYRLAIHLGLAFVILRLTVWYIFELRRDPADLLQARRRREGALMRWTAILVGLLFLQVMLGALMAGIDAGRSFPTWPGMAGEFPPSESFDLVPLWTNFFENPALVQFNHRLIGYVAGLLALFVWWRARRSALAGVRFRYNVMLAMVFLQIALGITTVLYAAQLHIALTHQLGAVVLYVLVLRAEFEAAYPVEQKIARG